MPSEEYSLGLNAYAAGQMLIDNPFDGKAQSSEWFSWRCGWLDARDRGITAMLLSGGQS